MKLLDLLKLKPNPDRRHFFRTMGAGAAGAAVAATIKPEEVEAKLTGPPHPRFDAENFGVVTIPSHQTFCTSATWSAINPGRVEILCVGGGGGGGSGRGRKP